MTITAKAVSQLREMTGAGMMDCKKALTETEGDLDKAVEYLRVKGIAKAEKKADRVAAEGLVSAWLSDDSRTAALVEVNCETDFVARNDDFVKFCDDLAAHAGSADFADIGAFGDSAFRGSTVEQVRREMIASIGENISVRRFQRVALAEPGAIAAYIHGGGRIGVLAVVNTTAAPADGSIADAARDVALHVAAMNPTCVRDSDLDPEVVEAERRVQTEKANEDAGGKPPEVIAKMIEGRINKWKKEMCLLTQPFVKDGEVTVAQFLDRAAKSAGVGVTMHSFVRFERGAGIEKAASNLADEVAATLRR
ncbi:MAG: elongation factor Ts [Myxococcales bacterium]|nr:elongation factor Ts [Myxococcales bacterium]MCB9521167.1 elongation factor Ts [Myxococcales bacterium]MCB9530525.1 elongation factor Ts [Myxococcales bacterium]